ncbi:MAG: 4Fe-4S binding protein [Sphaerochaetaceae bacterium]
MANIKSKFKRHDRNRNLFQFIFTLISNSYIVGFFKGRIYQGNSKFLCVPGLNCYSCPGAVGSCPIGSMQAVLGNRVDKVPFYVGGMVALYGIVGGRYTCGWLCPFGWLQDLLFKIKLPKGFRKFRKLKQEQYLEKLRYLILAVFVIILPLFLVDFTGQGSPYFCSWICPSGTLSGLFLLAANEPLRGIVGLLFAWKNFLLALTIIGSIIVYRPFCRYVCPLGAIYGLFNKVAIYHFEIDPTKCDNCQACQNVCKLSIKVFETPNSTACIRCKDCIAACPSGAIVEKFNLKLKEPVPLKI